MVVAQRPHEVKRQAPHGAFGMAHVQASQVANEILGYLVRHPEAQDTFDGIFEWWLLDERIERKRAEVREALAELLKGGLVLECSGKDARTHYRINDEKYTELAALYREGPAQKRGAT